MKIGFAMPARLYRVFIASAVLSLGIAVVLGTTTLWSVETRCGPVFDKQYYGDAAGCGAANSTRLHWVVAMVLLVIGFGAAGGSVYKRRSSRRATPLRVISGALLVTAVAAAVFATLFLTHGSNDSSCGSTLSRVTYDAEGCVPGWASARDRAWVAGSISAAALLIATGLEVDMPLGASRRQRTRAPAVE